ncbi:MAG: phosphotransferase enzyme family protein [Thalassovita sp.]
MTDPIAAKAAALWGISAQDIALAARRENTVLKARKDGSDYALRLHRPGYRTRAELLSELQWMEALALNGLTVPQPEPSLNGSLIEYIGDTPISLLSWMPGTPSGAGARLDVENPAQFAERLGRALAKMHALSDEWAGPTEFSRPSWDLEGLLGQTPLWGPFWDNPDLSPDESLLLQRTRDKAYDRLENIAGDLDFGLIHADIITENILTQNGSVGLIDFDDGGWGFRVFELATFLMRFLDHPEYMTLRSALLSGYATCETIDPETLDFFILLRALTYPGWIIPRRAEPGGKERSIRAVRTAVPLAQRFLTS